MTETRYTQSRHTQSGYAESGYAQSRYTTAKAFLEALRDANVSYIFANLGSDHPALIESLAEAAAKNQPMPRLLTCPNEMAALSAAHGYAQITGEPQAVFVHVECGTQSLAGAVHNAAKGRVPVLIFAGASPVTQEGELYGTRNEFIHWLQDVPDQRGIVRGYMKYDNEIRTGVNVKQLVYRALQLSESDPRGPVYLMGAREVMEQEVPYVRVDRGYWPPLPPSPAPEEFVDSFIEALASSRRPLVVTSYAGRNPAAVFELRRLCERAGIGVLESVPNYVNFPPDHPMYQGVKSNEPSQSPMLAEADLILVVDSDVPWIPSVNRPAEGVPVFHVDVDPLKENMPLWQLPARHIARADAATALRQINERLGSPECDGRRAHYTAQHEAWRKALTEREHPDGDAITPEFLTASVRKHVRGRTIVLNEGITNYKVVAEHMTGGVPVEMYASGGGSLGWNGGAAIGMKLARPDHTVIALTGDGSYMFSAPCSVHWMARRYKTPFLQIVYNNGGWRSPRLSMLALHPDGYASRSDDIGVKFEDPPDYSGIAAAAGGAFARMVKRPEELDAALTEALYAVEEEKRAAVLDVWLPH